jgi:Nucleotidyl transferase AbiEii toxin, Type IV TA system
VAGAVRLFEYPDFEQAMLRAAEHHGLSEQFIEKDYYITEILRIVVGELGERVVFKGGTSLSKGWGLIKRFSEDVDLFVNPALFDPPPGKNKINKILKDLTETVAGYPPLDWKREEGETITGLGRNDVLAYESHFADLPGLRAAIRLEPGIQSGSFPTSEEPITSLLAQYLREADAEEFLSLDDIEGFDMQLLHFRRTFVEKLFALHGKVERLLAEDHPLGRDARHYSDLHVLADQHEVRSMLASPEFEQIRLDYDERSREFFPRAYRPPPNLSFKDSPALFPDADLRARLEAEYEAECSLLFSDQSFASFDEVLDRFTEIRALL